MSVWLVVPSARPVEEVEPVLRAWTERGYKIALWRDAPTPGELANLIIWEESYPGYAAAVNWMSLDILRIDPDCDWIVTGGDDTLPDPDRHALGIAHECEMHFKGSFGIMQPTGDRFAGGSIDRIAGSPWMGREWCLRANGGKGPLWPEFTHMFGDECLKRTAEKLGVYWMRPDLVHMHRHFMRETDSVHSNAVARPIPPHLVKWNAPGHWEEMKAIFKRLEAEDFASCLPTDLR